MLEKLEALVEKKETNLTDIIFGKMSEEIKRGASFQSLNSLIEKYKLGPPVYQRVFIRRISNE